MQVIIDRFEGDFVVVELPDKRLISVPKAIMPTDAVEGTVINIEISKDETDRCKENISKLMSNLFHD